MRLIVALCTIALGFASPAQAQQVWRPPAGDFRVLLPANWGELDGPAEPGLLVRLGPGYRGPYDRLNECTVELREMAVPPGNTQAQTNAQMAGWDAMRMLGGGDEDIVHIRSFRNALVQDVRVATVVTEQRSGAVYAMTVFGLVRGNAFRMYTLACGASPPISDADLTNFDQLLASLRF